MKIVHRVTKSPTPEVSAEIADFGVPVKASTPVGITFEVDEADPKWPEIRAWIARRGAVDLVSTRFSKHEIEAADRLQMTSDWFHGYPQPDDDAFGYRPATYDLSEFCEQCGVGLRQVAPFQMRSEPKWGRRGIMQLYWVYDEFFVTPHVWATVFEPLGVSCRQVITTRGSELQTVVQLIVEDEFVDVVTEGLEAEVCNRCSRTKYLPVVRGPFPPLASEPSGAIAKSRQWFGSGGSAFRAVLVSQDVRRAMDNEKVRGVSFKPVAGSRSPGTENGQQRP